MEPQLVQVVLQDNTHHLLVIQSAYHALPVRLLHQVQQAVPPVHRANMAAQEPLLVQLVQQVPYLQVVRALVAPLASILIQVLVHALTVLPELTPHPLDP